MSAAAYRDASRERGAIGGCDSTGRAGTRFNTVAPPDLSVANGSHQTIRSFSNVGSLELS